MLRCAFLLLVACNSDPLYLPEAPPPMKRSPQAIVYCGGVQCDKGQYCCTHDDGIGGNCLDETASPICYTFFGCDGPEDCINGAVCCESEGHYNGSACVDPSGCNDYYSWLMCHSDADCPRSAPHCCPHQDTGVLAKCMTDCF